MSELVDGEVIDTFAERRTFPDHKRGGYEEVWELAHPAVLTMLSQTLMNFTDAVMVGRLGPVQLAGVGIAGTLLWGFFSFFNGLVMGVNTFVAQDFGAKRYRNIGMWTWQGVHLAIISGIVLAVSSIWSSWFLSAVGASPDVQAIGSSWLRIRLLGGIFMISWMCFSAFLRGLGDTRTPLWVTLGANGLNVLGNYCLIFGKLGFPRLETNGSAVATVIATGAGAVVFFAVFLSKRNSIRYATRVGWKPDPRTMARMIRISMPIGVQWFLDQGSFIVFSSFIARLSTLGLAASQAVLRLMGMSFMPVVGMSVAATTLVGQYIGSKQLNFATRSARSSMRLGLIYSAGIGAVFALFPDELISTMTSDPEVIKTGATILRLVAIFQVFDGVGIVASGCLRGAGDTIGPMLIMIGFAWCLFVPLAYLGGFVLKGGVVGAWVGATIYIISLALVFYMRFRSGKWKKIKI